LENEKHLLPVKSDFVFKLIFGDQINADILMGFLTTVLDIPYDEYESITIIDQQSKMITEQMSSGENWKKSNELLP